MNADEKYLRVTLRLPRNEPQYAEFLDAYQAIESRYSQGEYLRMCLLAGFALLYRKPSILSLGDGATGHMVIPHSNSVPTPVENAASSGLSQPIYVDESPDPESAPSLSDAPASTPEVAERLKGTMSGMIR